MALVLEDTHYAYALRRGYEVPALAGVSLVVEPGELVLVVGSTGSGKSTLLRICAGLLAPQAGAATLDGVALSASGTRGEVGLVFQDPESQLFADTLIEDVAFGPVNLGATGARAREVAAAAMNEVGLDPDVFGHRSPFSLSGGEARRAAIAGVIAMRPRYLLADEPTAGLDVSGRAAVLKLLLAQRARAGVLVVSHAAEEFLGSADRLVVMSDGIIEWTGRAADVIADPSVVESTTLRLPDVLEVQRLARTRGLAVTQSTLEPTLAAERLALAAGRS